MQSDGNVEPQNSAQNQRDLYNGKCHVYQSTAFAKTGRDSFAEKCAANIDVHTNVKQKQGYAHAELKKLANEDEEFVFGEVSKDVHGKHCKAQYDSGNALVVAAGVNANLAMWLKKLGHKFTDAEAHDDLRGVMQQKRGSEGEVCKVNLATKKASESKGLRRCQAAAHVRPSRGAPGA